MFVRRCYFISYKYDWSTIKIEYEKGNSTYKSLEKRYGPHHKTIGKKARAEGWIKGDIPKTVVRKTKAKLTTMLSKSEAEINKEIDDILDKATKEIKKTILSSDVTAVDLNVSINSLKITREERVYSIRGKLTPAQQAKLDLDREKFKHKKDMDLRGKNPKPVKGKEEEEPQGNFID